MATEKQLEANRRNAMKSRGPKTLEGKERSRRNALTHGLTAEALDVLPGEDRGAFDGRIDAWFRDLRPRNEVEESMIRRAAVLSWKLDRADRHEVAVLTRKIRERAEVDRARHSERVSTLIGRLLPTVDEVEQGGFDSIPAAKLLAEIETTAEGCGWILECWDQIRQAILGLRPWTHCEEMAIVRLTEQGPATIDDPTTLDLVVASRILIRPNGAVDADRWIPGPFPIRFDREGLREACGRQPKSHDEACEVLLAAVDKATSRLEIVRKIRERDGDDWGAEESAAVASFDASAEGEKLRRYQTTAHREMIRSLESVSKLRLQAAKLEKEELASALRNEPNLVEVAAPACPAVAVGGLVAEELSASKKPVELRNESNSPEARPERRTHELSGWDDRQTFEASPACSDPAILRNEPKSEVEGVEWVEISCLDRADEVPIPLRAAS